MQHILRHYVKEGGSRLGRSARFAISFTPLMAILFSGAAHFAARPSPSIDGPRVRLHTSSFDPVVVADLTPSCPAFSTGTAEYVAKPTEGSASSTSPPLPVQLAPAQDVVYPAFALEVAPGEQLVKITDTSAPGTWDTIAGTSGTDYVAGDFVGRDYGKLYVLDLTSNELHSLDTATGDDTTVGSSTPIPGQLWTGATGTADGTLYASSANGTISYLYTVNTTTGVTTVVGEITSAPCIIDIAINADGEMFGVDTCSDVLVQIDPVTGAGTPIGSIGYDADNAQGMDFEDRSGILYLAAFNVTLNRGELRIADTATGNSVLVGPFPGGSETDALAFVEPTLAPVQILQNPGFESGWANWQTGGSPSLSNTSHGGTWSARFLGEEVWVWQEVFIPPDATDVSISYWLTGLSSEFDWDSDIICGGLWNLTRQTQLAGGCFDLHYFYSYPMQWKTRTYKLDAAELANVAGRRLVLGFKQEQDWLPGYSKTSTAWVDDITLYVTRPYYDYQLYAPLVVRQN
jgi:hypothetical protein